MAHLADALLLIEVNKVDGELHEEGVDRFTRRNPKAFASAELGLFQQARAALGAAIGYVCRGSECGVAGLVADTDSHSA